MKKRRPKRVYNDPVRPKNIRRLLVRIPLGEGKRVVENAEVVYKNPGRGVFVFKTCQMKTAP
ncbi:MAG TPA: hypothetical protein DHU55_01695 [Blastocatellia bacterium]|nr:hypothetical protein [Blastocatellia bacterium]HCX28478.1 hypothetical protein [Blastocatellia bacterium]